MALLGDKAVGDIVKIKIDGTAKDFIIVHQGKPSDLYDESCNGTWLLMKDLYIEEMAYSQYRYGYNSSQINSYFNTTFINLFDSDIKEAIKQVKVPCYIYIGGGAGADNGLRVGSDGLSCKVFLLSYYELGLAATSNAPVDGACLSYFKGTTATDSKRIAKYNDSARLWWTRTPLVSGSLYTSVFCIGDNGASSTNSCTNSSSAVRPALILPSDLALTSDGFVTINNFPVITGITPSGGDIGEVSAPINFTYTANDEDGNPVTVREYLDDVLTRTYTATLGAENTFEAVSDPVQFQKILNGQHTLKIVANDGMDDSEPYTVTFNKQVKTAVISLASPLTADDVIKAAVVSVSGKFPWDSSTEVYVTNNALDENPVWEDMTREFEQSTNHVFANVTAANGFAFNFRVTVKRGESGEQGFITGIGGAFE